jgi:tetratricopeptide (TPR) repeat protein
MKPGQTLMPDTSVSPRKNLSMAACYTLAGCLLLALQAAAQPATEAPAQRVVGDTLSGAAAAGFQDRSTEELPPESALRSRSPPIPAGETALGHMELALSFERAAEKDDAVTAAMVGSKWLAALEREFDDEHTELVLPLTRVGTVQRQAGLLEQAEDNLLRAVELAQLHDGRFSERQLTPLTELGRVYQDMREHALAIATFNEARGMSRQVLGLLNLRQVEMLSGMATSLLELQAPEEADNRQVEAFRIAERHYGPDSLELLPELYRLASWQRQTGQFEGERTLYMRAMRIIEADSGNSEDVRMVDPLRRLAKSMQFAASFTDPRAVRAAPTGHPSADQALNRALDIVRSQELPYPDAEALLLIDQGDWHMALTRRNAALQRYEEAWQALEHAENGKELRERWFSRPQAVTSPQPSWLGIRPRGSEPNLEDGWVVASYTVDARGQAQDIEILESHPAGRKDTTVRRTLRSTRFRPRLEDGKPVDAENQRYVFLFGYTP